MRNLDVPGTTIVRNREQARKAIDVLYKYRQRVHAWDTETINIDPKINSPVGHGEVICASAFAGPDVDFGNGPRLFIDNYADALDTILEFQEYLEESV